MRKTQDISSRFPLSPVGDRLVVERVKPASLAGKDSLIIIPDNAKEPATFGRVLSVGIGVKEIQDNYLVAFGKYSGTELTINGRDVLFMREEEVIAFAIDGEWADKIAIT